MDDAASERVIRRLGVPGTVEWQRFDVPASRGRFHDRTSADFESDPPRTPGRNHLQEFSMSNPMSTPRAASYAMLVLAPALLLAACGGNGDSATSSQSSPASQAASDRPVTDSVHVDAAIEKNPCELAPAEMVAGLFGVPAADLERESTMSSACVYKIGRAHV